MRNITFGSTAAALAISALIAVAPHAIAAPGGDKNGTASKQAEGTKKPADAAKKPAGGAKEADSAKVSRLEKTTNDLLKQIRQMGGGRTPKESINKVKQSNNKLRDRIERAEEAEKKSGMTAKEIEAQRKKLEDEWIINSSDIKSTAASTGVQEVGKAFVASEFAKKAIGAGGIWIMAFDFATREAIKQYNISQIDKLLKQEKAKPAEFDRLIAKLYKDLSDGIRRLKALNELRARYDKSYSDLVEMKDRLGPARVHANLKRVDDTAGDREEIRKAKQYGKEHMIIKPVDGPPVPRARPGIRRASSISRNSPQRSRNGTPKENIAYVREDGTVVADPDPTMRLLLLRERDAAFGGGDGGGGAD